jgi:hypothetical protein
MTTEEERLRRHVQALAAANHELGEKLAAGATTARRAGRAGAWVEELAFSGTAAAPVLVGRADGATFLLEGPVRRAVPSGLLAAAIAEAVGPVRPAADGELDQRREGPPVEVLEGPGGAPFVVVGGRRLPIRGLPLPHPVTADEMQSFPEGPEINVAAANVARARLEEALGLRYQLTRVRTRLRRLMRR